MKTALACNHFLLHSDGSETAVVLFLYQCQQLLLRVYNFVWVIREKKHVNIRRKDKNSRAVSLSLPSLLCYGRSSSQRQEAEHRRGIWRHPALLMCGQTLPASVIQTPPTGALSAFQWWKFFRFQFALKMKIFTGRFAGQDENIYTEHKTNPPQPQLTNNSVLGVSLMGFFVPLFLKSVLKQHSKLWSAS